MQPIVLIDFSTKMHLKSLVQFPTEKKLKFYFPSRKNQSHNVVEMTKQILFHLFARGTEPAAFTARKVCP